MLNRTYLYIAGSLVVCHHRLLVIRSMILTDEDSTLQTDTTFLVTHSREVKANSKIFRSQTYLVPWFVVFSDLRYCLSHQRQLFQVQRAVQDQLRWLIMVTGKTQVGGLPFLKTPGQKIPNDRTILGPEF